MSILLEEFTYARPETLEQLTTLVRRYEADGDHYIFSAGGTDVVPKLKTQVIRPDHMISLTGLEELNHIEKRDNHIIIGALTPLSDLATDDLIQQYLPALGHAARKVASPQIRNRATIGGNIMVENRCIYINQSPINRECHAPCFKADGDICHLVKSAKRGDEVLCQARFVSDTAPVLLLLEAEINIMGPEGTRKIKLDDLYLPDGIDSRNIASGEVITTIEVEIPEDTDLHYEKLAIRKALDFPSLGVAVRMTGEDLSVALTGLNTLPGVFRAKADDYDIFDNMVSDICDQAMGFAVTYQQDFFQRGYRKAMIPVFIRRAVMSILKERQ